MRTRSPTGWPGIARIGAGTASHHCARSPARSAPVTSWISCAWAARRHGGPCMIADCRRWSRTHGASILRTVWDTRLALAAIADRIGGRYAGDLDAGHGEQVVTTREMLDEGLLTSIGQANWAIRATAPVEGVETDLPLDPWCLGAWLADGNANEGAITSDPSNGDLDHVIRRFEDAGFEVRRRKKRDQHRNHRTVLHPPRHGRARRQTYPRGVLPRLCRTTT